MTDWDKPCCRIEGGENASWVGTLGANGNLDGKVRGNENKHMCFCMQAYSRLAVRNEREL